ncbi:hypothetical protein ACLOJK_028680, partial [Asimina triloba]
MHYRWAFRWRLRDEFAVAGAIKTPAMVDTLQPSPLINPSFGKRREAVRAAVIKHLPFLLRSIPPHHHIKTHHLGSAAAAGVVETVVEGGEPVEEMRNSFFLFRRIEEELDFGCLEGIKKNGFLGGNDENLLGRMEGLKEGDEKAKA